MLKDNVFFFLQVNHWAYIIIIFFSRIIRFKKLRNEFCTRSLELKKNNNQRVHAYQLIILIDWFYHYELTTTSFKTRINGLKVVTISTATSVNKRSACLILIIIIESLVISNGARSNIDRFFADS